MVAIPKTHRPPARALKSLFLVGADSRPPLIPSRHALVGHNIHLKEHDKPGQ